MSPLIRSRIDANLDRVKKTTCESNQQAFMTQNGAGGQNGAAVKRLHGNVQDMVSNPAVTRNENQPLGTPLQKVAQ